MRLRVYGFGVLWGLGFRVLGFGFASPLPIVKALFWGGSGGGGKGEGGREENKRQKRFDQPKFYQI